MTQNQLSKRLPFLKKFSLFHNLSDGQIRELIKIMTIQEVKTGDVITREGASGNTVFILLEGEVEISKRLLLPLWGEEYARQEKSLIRLSKNDHAFFGEMSLFAEKPERSASIFALQPTTLAVLQKKDLLHILDGNSEIGSVIYKNIAEELTHRLIKANRDILKLTTAFCLALEGE
jgi:CRP/FNR family transcriptional regulator/CRP/FNR family cyclic AMP-dependent transcriptional regulator